MNESALMSAVTCVACGGAAAMAIPIGLAWAAPLGVLLAILNGAEAYKGWVKDAERRARLKELELLVKVPA